MANKKFINGVFIREHVFGDGGSILKMSIRKDAINALADQLESACSGDYCNLVINRLREPSKSKSTGKVVSTHSLAVDDWQPKARAEQAASGFDKLKAAANEPEQSEETPF